MSENKKNLHPIIEFPSEEAKNEYEKMLAEKGFHTMEIGPTINLEEIKKRRFNDKEENGK